MFFAPDKHFIHPPTLHPPHFHPFPVQNAFRCYVRSRDYCTTSKHILSMCLSAIRAAVEMNNWMHVQNHVAKAEQTPDAMVGGGGDREGVEVQVLTDRLSWLRAHPAHVHIDLPIRACVAEAACSSLPLQALL